MATIKELKTLSAPAVYIDGRRVKIIPNSCTAELPGEVKTRAVSAGGDAYDVVHGVDVEAYYCAVKFDVANTGEMVELVQDYKSRARRIETSTIKLVEDGTTLNYDRMVLSNKLEIQFSAEGNISLEWHGRYSQKI